MNVDIKGISTIAATMLVLDIAWITLFMNKMFTPMIEKIQRKSLTMRPLGGILAYGAMIGLFSIFKDDLTPQKAFLLGAGVIMTYDFTSYALFSDWDLKIAAIDSMWGGILFLLTYFVFKKITY